MESVIKLLIIIGIPLLCIWAVDGCYKINEEEGKHNLKEREVKENDIQRR